MDSNLSDLLPAHIEEGPRGIFPMPDPDHEGSPLGESQRVRIVKTIAVWAMAVTLLYIVGYAAMAWWAIVAFCAVFGVWYGASYIGCTRGYTRSAAVLLIGGGTVHLTGLALFFLPPLAGMHLFLAVIPIFALIAIHHRDQAWAMLYTFVSVGSLLWVEFGRDTFEPALVVPLDSHMYGVMRAMAAGITITMIIGVFNSFLQDLSVARTDLAAAHNQSEALLLNILPTTIAERLKRTQDTIADYYEEASVLFADLVGFTKLSSQQSANETVSTLNAIFSAFDASVASLGLEKIKTIGDGYMVASGVPTPRPDHASQLLCLALMMQDSLRAYNERTGHHLELRIGIHSGPVTAGVIGSRKFAYDIWGDTVNVASRMESTGLAGRIQVSATVAQATAERFAFDSRGPIDVKGKGEMHTFLVISP